MFLKKLFAVLAKKPCATLRIWSAIRFVEADGARKGFVT
jgi:hypothetical protein